MNLLQTIILAIVQGLTEFIPVSSSGHLVIFPALFGWELQSTSFDTVVHAGTLLAIVIYFRKDLSKLLKGIFSKDAESISLGKKIFLGMLPAAFLAFFIEAINKLSDGSADTIIKNEYFIIFNFVFIGILFIISDILVKKNDKNIEDISMKESFKIGVGQMLSLFRGVSRSGITILAGLSQNMTRQAAAKFSFLMGIPLIFLAFVVKIGEMVVIGGENINILNLIVGFIVSFLFGLAAIDFMMKFLSKRGLSIFGYYRIIFGIIALIIILGA